MPLHAYNAPKQHLRHSNSALIITENSQHPLTVPCAHPDHARQYALIAASKAMERSRSSASNSLSREDSRKTLRTPRSIHFAHNGSATPQDHNSINPQLQQSSDSRREFADLAASCPHYYESMITTSEHGMLKESYSGQPSSYRRLKKARSLMSTRSLGDRAFNDRNYGSTIHRTHSLRQASSSVSLRAPSLRLKLRRSLNMLRSHKQRREQTIPYQPELTCRPESIALARSEFLKISASGQSPNQGPKTPTSIVQSSPRTLRQSVRSHDPLSGSQTIKTSKVSTSPAPTKRSVSSSLRRRLRRVFSMSTRSQEGLPPQQVDAPHNHFGNALDRSRSENAFDSYCNDDPELSRRQSLYIPSDAQPEANPGLDLLDDIRSFQCSNSLRSTSQSRLTSWTNSSIGGSARSDLGDTKRLSVIREDGGPHQPSSSAGRHVGGLSVFRQPLQLGNGAQVDSQRIYSALLKRIDQEQVEMEQTGAALQVIHAACDEKPQHGIPQSTVRLISSGTSLTAKSSHDEELSPSMNTRLDTNDGETPSKRYHHGSSRRRHHRYRAAEKQSAFFGASTEVEPPDPSPFRKLLQQQRCSAAPDPPVIKSDTMPHLTEHDAFAGSSESLYSRTTNGGTNMNYTSPIGSTEDFHPLRDQSQGIATIVCSNYANPRLQQEKLRLASAVSMSTSEKGQWKGWLEHQMAGLVRQNSRTIKHFREPAQIDPQDVEVGQLPSHSTLTKYANPDFQCRGPRIQPSVEANTSTLRPVSVTSISSPVVTDKLQVSPYVTPQPGCHHDSTGREESQAISGSFDGSIGTFESAGKQPQIARKISTADIARFLRLRRSQPVLHSNHDMGKENKPSSLSGRAKGRMIKLKDSDDQSACTTIALKESNVNARNDSHGKDSSPASQDTDASDKDLADQPRTILSARLSRPFDMDVPEYNRPFDSMYLGKADRPSSENSRAARLSVASSARALRATKSYGGLGRPRLEPISYSPGMVSGSEPTALPQIPDEDAPTRTPSLGSLTINSRRMVSNFLRSRRKDAKVSEQRSEPVPTSSPAFI